MLLFTTVLRLVYPSAIIKGNEMICIDLSSGAINWIRIKFLPCLRLKVRDPSRAPPKHSM